VAQLEQPKSTAFSEEEVCFVSKEAPCAIWTGTKILYSGDASGCMLQASGYNFGSGESDISPINTSGWGEIRVPELNQLHKVFVFPKNPCIIARAAYTALTVSTASGYPSGHGGCSGKIALIHYIDTTAGSEFNGCFSGSMYSGNFNSGLIDIIAVGSQM